MRATITELMIVPTQNHLARHIRVFVSSTFRDMQGERDHLVKFIFPQLRKLCESRGVTWGEVDLRWGIPDEEKAEGKVLPLCLEEIQGCRPYFIGLLGERYGWVPESIPDDVVEQHPWIEKLRECSVTEIEIIHGVFRNETMHAHAFFYLRDPGYIDCLPAGNNRADFESETTEARAKLTELKQRLRHARDKKVCQLRENYHDQRELGQWLLEDFTRLINDLFPEGQTPDPLDREAADLEAFAQSRARVYIGRQEYFDRLDAHMMSQDPPLVVLGESGIGKSALLANWFIRYRDHHSDEFTVLHFIGGPH